MTVEAPGLFDGVRILEIGQFVAAPMSAQLFAHGNADVIKLEPVTGDLTRVIDPLRSPQGEITEGRAYVVKAFGKRALPVDLSTEAGRAVAQEIAATCDVVISNLRPGTAPRLGLDYDSLQASNPRLVYGEISGYGDDGPLALKPSLDLIAQSWTGVRLAGGMTPEGALGHYEPYFCDYTASLLLAFGIAAALRQREITGVGQRVSTSLAHAGLYVQHRSASLFEESDAWKRELVQRRENGEPLATSFAERASRIAPVQFFFATYETSDGLLSVGATGAMGKRFCEMFDAVDPRLSDSWADREARPTLLAQTRASIAQSMARYTTAQVMAMLDDAGIPCAQVRLLEEMLVDPDAHAAGLLYEGHHPRLGRYTMPTPPVRFSGATYRTRPEIASHGEHTDEVLTELGYDQEVIDRLVADGIVIRSDAAST